MLGISGGRDGADDGEKGGGHVGKVPGEWNGGPGVDGVGQGGQSEA